MINNPIYKIIAYPLSKLFGLGVCFRNLLFNRGIITSKSYPIPIICVGNLSVGGTGKTPHIEYLVALLKKEYRVAVISRGYKRKSKGMQLSSSHSTPEQLGDEPYQIFAKNRDITVVADSNRQRAIEYLLASSTPPEVILLDDAYQHRYVKAGIYILLSEYMRPFYQDNMMPLGRLREPAKNKDRAQIIVMTKSPESISEECKKEIREKINPTSQQNVFFSRLFNPTPKDIMLNQEAKLSTDTEILLVTGIANPMPIEEKIKTLYNLQETLHFSDHCNFSEKETSLIMDKFNEIENNKKAIIVTEKDAVKLRNTPYFNDSFKKNIYYLPLEIVFLQTEKNLFNQLILDYVAENQRNN